MRASSVHPDRSGGDQHGAAAVEFALIAGLLIMVLLTVVETGLLLRAHHGVGRAAESAARLGGVRTPSAQADGELLQLLMATSGVGAQDIRRVIVFHGGPGRTTPSATCSAGTPSTEPGAECNIYTSTDIARPLADFGCGDAGLDLAWCPSGRTRAGGDLLGVEVEVAYRSATGLIPGTVVLRHRAVAPLEVSER